jgi:hypothetical protein
MLINHMLDFGSFLSHSFKWRNETAKLHALIDLVKESAESALAGNLFLSVCGIHRGECVGKPGLFVVRGSSTHRIAYKCMSDKGNFWKNLCAYQFSLKTCGRL